MTAVRWLDSVPSTNTALRDIPVEHGDCIATVNQTAGRGRVGREWNEIAGKGLAVSLVLTEPVAVPTLLPLVAGVAAIDVLRELAGVGDRVWMKWPNDLYIGARKVAGILTEMPEPSRIIVGLGMNLTQGEDELPVATATSLALEGIAVDPAEFVDAWRSRVINQSAETGEQRTVDAVNNRLGLRGETVRIEFPDRSTRIGIVHGVDSSGALLLDSGNPVVAGDITRLRPAD
ncbi:MAG: biotin--[acetyl-CoA-carboxylase] ligase [Microbacteriaceae bacterium]